MSDLKMSFLYGYSYAWKAGYRPKAFDKLEDKLFTKKESTPRADYIEIDKNYITLVEQIIDSYGKIGFMYISKKYLTEQHISSKRNHTHVHYHLYNFIYDCKAFLDSVSIMLNDFYGLGKSGGEIDLKWGTFRELLIEKESRLKNCIDKHTKWILTVVDWRDALIHKYSVPLGFTLSEMKTPEELDRHLETKPPFEMLVEPAPYLSANFPELNRKYGSAFTEILPFCDDWITNACDIYDSVCDVVADSIY